MHSRAYFNLVLYRRASHRLRRNDLWLQGFFDLATGHSPNVVLANLHAPVWWGAFAVGSRSFLWHSFSPGPQRLSNELRQFKEQKMAAQRK